MTTRTAAEQAQSIAADAEIIGTLPANPELGGGPGVLLDSQASPEWSATPLELQRGDLVLVQASRGLQLGRVADRLVGGEV